jgi:cyclopropane-fatty-acyl-phospholipid synthase
MFLQSRLDRLIGRLGSSASVPLRLKLWNGRSYDLSPNPPVTITIPNASALRYLVSPDLNRLGEAYVEGRIRVDGQVEDAFRAAESLVRHAAAASTQGLLHFARHTKNRDREAIEYHYDVSNEFYRLFLDANMVYSCAYYRSDADTLDLAQEQKLDHILNKLRVAPGERLLDIGCGWGALILRAAKKYGAIATGVTLSQQQHEFAKQRILEEGLEGRCEVRLQDYRDVPEAGSYDKIASVGMFEHVGVKHLGGYFAGICRLLKDGGLVLNHGITATDPDSRWVGMGAGEFIHRYVFPDGELPHISVVLREMAQAGMEVADVESLRRHYARTCHEWANRIDAHRDQAVAAAGEKRFRIWQIYLAGCAYGFEHGWMNIYQVLACKDGAPALNTLPLTRDYMYRG